MPRPFQVIDVFTDRRFAGNPAAVVLDAQGLGDQEMQRIAAEFNLSETTFVLPVTEESKEYRIREVGVQSKSQDVKQFMVDPAIPSVRFRWFTPFAEVRMCRHATIAGVRAMLDARLLRTVPPSAIESLSYPEEVTARPNLNVHTISGILKVFVENFPGSEEIIIWLELIRPMLAPLDCNPDELCELVRCPVDIFEPAPSTVRTQDDDGIAFVRDVAALNEIRPDFGRLGEWLRGRGLRGLLLSTIRTVTPSLTVQSRFFAPSVGINEDPVTGSVHGPLAVHLAKQGVVPIHDDGQAGMMCAQGIPGGRTGIVWALVRFNGELVEHVRIGGRSVTAMCGTLLDG